MTERTIPVEVEGVQHALVSTARTLFQATNPLNIVRTATQSFLEFIARVIILRQSNVKGRKLASSVRVSTWWCRVNVTGVDIPFVQCASNSFLLQTTNVTYNLLQRKSNLNRQSRREVAWWRHPLCCLFMLT